MKEEHLFPQVMSLTGHLDSIWQRQQDMMQIEESFVVGKTDALKNERGFYYSLLKEGAGKQISAEDTIVVHYKGYLFPDASVFDQTKDKPASFPLKRLIKGWQVALPLRKVGGKIKMIIPSDWAYSIRTRSAKIPPNSTLVFEVEVLEAR